jgi:hypothetical protein
MPAEQRKLDVVEREQAIFRYLRGIDRAVGATIRELHEQLTVMGAAAQGGGEVRDTVTVQAYHKLVTRLVLDGRLVEVGDPGADAQRYALAPALATHDLGVRAKQVVREAWSGGEAATARSSTTPALPSTPPSVPSEPCTHAQERTRLSLV